MRWVNRVGPLPIDPKNHFLQFSHWNRQSSTVKRWEFLWIALSMSIWHHRNSLVFNNQPFNPDKVMDDALFHTWSWLKCVEKGFQSHFNFWSTNLKDEFSQRGWVYLVNCIAFGFFQRGLAFHCLCFLLLYISVHLVLNFIYNILIFAVQKKKT